MKLRILAAVASLGLGACERPPDAYAMPAQEPQFAGFKTHSVRVVNMDDADAQAYFVRDIQNDLHGTWRWAMQRPAVKIKVHAPAHVKYWIDFTVAQVTFADTGPVEIVFTVNDRVLDRVRYVQAGSYHFEKEIPAEWLTANADATVGAEIDRMWTSKLDGAQFGFIVTRMGLTE